MSCYAWESGTIILPTAEVPKVRKVLIKSINAVRDLVPGEAAKAHAAAAGTRSLRLYQERVLGYEGHFRPLLWGGVQGKPEAERIATAIAHDVLQSMVYQGKVVKPTRAMIDSVLPRATNRTANFSALTSDGLGEAGFTLDGRDLIWDVPENNHARERANDSPIAQQVWAALAKVTWTRGSGGQIVGNDEYSRDDSSLGGGGNYLIAEFGPSVKSRTRSR